MKNHHRCEWCTGTEIEQIYHDEEWGVPLHDDRKLFEFLLLDGAQAGLSWLTILKKREHKDKKGLSSYLLRYLPGFNRTLTFG